MTGRREIEPLQKVTLNLYAGDFAELRRMYSTSGAGAVVRTLVRSHLKKIRAKLDETKPALEVDLKEIMEHPP